MAWYDINHPCGHSRREQLYGKHTERERCIAWLEGRPCPDCWQEAKQQARAEAAGKAGEAAKQEGLPTLAGSEKQVPWATTIRADLLPKIRERIKDLKGPLVHPEMIGEIDVFVSSIPDAKWWIDRRSWGANGIVWERLADLMWPELPAVDGHRDEVVQARWSRAESLLAVYSYLRTTDAETEAEETYRGAAWSWLVGQASAAFWSRRAFLGVEDLMERHAAYMKESEKAKAEQEAAAAKKAKEVDATRKLWEEKDRIAKAIHDFLNQSTGKVEAVVKHKRGRQEATVYGDFTNEEVARTWLATNKPGIDWEERELVIRPSDAGRLAFQVEVWNRSGEKRVYVGHGFNGNCATYWHTGSDRKKPGTLELTEAAKAKLGDRLPEFKAFLVSLCEAWNAITVRIAADGSAANE